MSVTSTVAEINAQAATYAPLALNTVLGIEQAAAELPGASKKQVAVNIIQVAARSAENVPVPTVAGIAALVDLFVSILNAAGVFKHTNPTPTGPTYNPTPAPNR